MDIKKLMEERNALAKQIEELADRQEKWTGEDRSQWDTLNAAYDDCKERCDQHTLAVEIAERRAQFEADAQTEPRPSAGGGRFTIAPAKALPTDEQRALAMQAWMLANNGLDVSERHKDAARLCGTEFRQNQLIVNIQRHCPTSGYQMFSSQSGRRDWSKFEGRMDTQTPTEGAELVPTLFQYELEKTMLAYGGFRGISRILPTAGGNPLDWPTVDDTGNVAIIVDEGASVGSDTPATTGNIRFGAFKYSSQPVLVTEELIEDSAFNMSALMGNLLGERLGRGEAAHLATGNGTTQPEGCVTGSTKGADSALNTAITADELIDLQGSIDPAYESLPSIGWAFNKATLTAIRKLKGPDEQYIWRPGLTLGEPDLLLGAPYAIIQEMADIGASAKPVLYGAFEKFVIREVSAIRFYRLVELYRANDQTGFLAMHRVDSKVIQPEAIKHMACPA